MNEAVAILKVGVEAKAVILVTGLGGGRGGRGGARKKAYRHWLQRGGRERERERDGEVCVCVGGGGGRWK